MDVAGHATNSGVSDGAIGISSQSKDNSMEVPRASASMTVKAGRRHSLSLVTFVSDDTAQKRITTGAAKKGSALGRPLVKGSHEGQ